MDDPYGAFCRDTHVALVGEPEGPLAGRSFGVKDIFDISGHRTGYGNPTWLETHPPADETASAVRRLLDAGADMVGKTLTDEMAYSLTGENVHYGTPVNPAAPDRVPGGSSNGSASAVAGGLVDFALGTDCGGSVRLPASYCGILGMRPSLGRVPVDGVVPFSASFDVVGWFTREADLLERVGRVLLADDGPAFEPRRLVIADDAFEMLDRRVGEALGSAVEHMAEAFGERRHVTVSPEGLPEWFEVFRVIQASEIWANRGEWITTAKPDLGRGIRERMAWASRVEADEVARCRRERSRIQARLDELLGHGDVLCLPTSPRVAPLKESPADDVEVRYRHQAMSLLCVSGLGGLPQISLPLAELDGLPLGLSIVARPGADLMLLGLARRLMAGRDGS
ncbi:MAG: amidase [Alphaproteobacteria bacterium]|jgi:amidase|nr:amidase [Alphaproteobacteria bacterium]